MLSNYSFGGIKIEGAASVVDNNYFENTGNPGASTINYYIYDTGIQTIITSNRFDDYGSTRTSGPLLYLAGASDGIVTSNRVLDNRPGGAGTRAGIEVSITNWQPNTAGATNWGTYQFVKNGTTLPRLYHPVIQYDLDGNSLSYAPLAKHRDMTFVDLSGGGLKTTNSEYQDASGRWYYNEAPNQNAHVFVPNAATLASGNLTYTVTAQCIVASPYSVNYFLKFTDGAGVPTTTSGTFTFAGNTTVETNSATLVVPVSATMQDGNFAAWLNPTHANTYSINITS